MTLPDHGMRPICPCYQAGQESRSTRHRSATNLVAMDITIQSSFLPQNDPEAAVAFYRDVLGFEVRNDVGYGGMHWITVGPPSQPGTSIVLFPPEATPGITDDERRTIAEMMAKGSYGIVVLATKDLDATFARLQASDAEVVQEPTEQPYGIRDCAFRDPAGNMIRINQAG
jgi:catechol 2,3-dioxygenase-like lactoylglutathione lyase family enzyme